MNNKKKAKNYTLTFALFIFTSNASKSNLLINFRTNGLQKRVRILKVKFYLFIFPIIITLI